MAQVQVSKETAQAVLGTPADTAGVSKLVAYAVLYPGVDSGGSLNVNQGHTYAQVLRPED